MTKPYNLQSSMSTPKRTKILMIYTGGTIGMIENPITHSLEPFHFDHLLSNVPKIRLLDFDIKCISFDNPLDSSAMTPSHWIDIASTIADNYEEFDGFVVLHGTDTMAYTASALSFMLQNLNKPVIITGSQLPIGEVRTDGEENLITALQVAAAKDSNGEQMVKEVAILFENYLWRGNRSTKHSSDKFNAFTSNNFPHLAQIGLDILFNKEALLHPKPSGPLKISKNMDDNVMYIDLFPGIKKEYVQRMLTTPGLKGVVMKTFGSGNGPTAGGFLESLKKAIDRGVVIVNISQCSNGSVLPIRYDTGRELTEIGVISGHDLTSEAAITKMMYLFGTGCSSEEVKQLMEKSLCGEMTIDEEPA